MNFVSVANKFRERSEQISLAKGEYISILKGEFYEKTFSTFYFLFFVLCT